MFRRQWKSTLGATYLLGLLVLLCLLAAMQYRWADEAVIAERQRMQNALRETLRLLETDFDGEINRLVASFMGGPRVHEGEITEQWRAELARELASGHSAWSGTTDQPGMFGRILLAESGREMPLLFRLDLSARAWAPLAWPQELLETRDLLIRNTNGTLTEGDLRAASPLPGRLLFPFLTLPDLPGFVSALLVEPVPAAESGGARRQSRAGIWRVRACLILCLNGEYVSRQWLPSLCRRFLSPEGQPSYDYLVRDRRHPERVICSSATGDPAGLIAAPDARIGLLQLRNPELMNRLLLQTQEELVRSGIPREPARDLRGEIPAGGERRRPSMPRREASSLPRKPSGVPGGGPRERIEKEEQASRESQSDQPEVLRVIAERVAANGWELMVRHHSGSVEAAVAQLRMRNLAVAFGILLILAASLLAFAMAVRRAGRLARQQLEFVASISHELRTPVTAVCSLSENLADGVVGPPDQVAQYGRMILREGRRLGHLVEQTLEFAGIRSGRKPLRLRPLEVEAVTREALQSCEALLQESGATLETRIDAGLPAISGDPDSLRCALENLVGNAVKYSPGGATVTLAARSAAKGNRVEIVVSDRGMGIEAEDLKHVFEPFYRGRNAAAAQIRGAGIGLSLVKRIIEEHGGEIHMSSRPGQGTEVTVRIPAFERKPHGENPAG